MTLLGAILSNVDMTSEESAPILNGFDEVTGLTTVAAALEDMTGLTFDLTTNVTGRIMADMTVECSATGGNSVGGWAISINGVDGQEIARFLSGANDTGVCCVKARSASLGAGTYTVKGRMRRVSGGNTVNSDVGQLAAIFVAG